MSEVQSMLQRVRDLAVQYNNGTLSSSDKAAITNEVGQLYSRRGEKPPVTAATGLWALLLGWFVFVGFIVWFVKTNGALNAYWRSLGAR